MHWQIKLPLPGRDDWFTVCDCTTIEYALEVLRILACKESNHATEIKIDCMPGDKFPPSDDSPGDLGT